MHRMNVREKTVLKKMEMGLKKVLCLLRRYAGQIGYYTCVALVLTAVAVAAERYRNGKDVAEALVLPAVELTTPAPDRNTCIFEVPDKMTVLKAYTDLPEWNEIYGQWETHAAVDWLSVQDEVSSLSEGIVRTVGKSGVYGGFVEVESGEYLLRYASITPDADVLPGVHLKKGDRLGKADTSMPSEAHMGTHLHLELYRKGMIVNFLDECE